MPASGATVPTPSGCWLSHAAVGEALSVQSRGSFAAGAAVGEIRFKQGSQHMPGVLPWGCASHLGRQSADGQGWCAFPGLSALPPPCLRSGQLVRIAVPAEGTRWQ